MIRRVDVICASACCRGIYFNQIKVQLILIYNRAPRGGTVMSSPPQKKKQNLSTDVSPWERAHARIAPFPKIHPAFFSALCAHFL